MKNKALATTIATLLAIPFFAFAAEETVNTGIGSLDKVFSQTSVASVNSTHA